MSGGLYPLLTRANAPAVAIAGWVVLGACILLAVRIARQDADGAGEPPTTPGAAEIKMETAKPPRLEVTASPFTSEHLNEVIAQKLKAEEEKLRAAEEAKRKAEEAARATPVPPPAPVPAPKRQITIIYRGLLQRPDAAPMACIEATGAPMQFLHAGDSIRGVKILNVTRDQLKAEAQGQPVDLPRGVPVQFEETAP